MLDGRARRPARQRPPPCGRCSTRPASCCTPTSAAPRCPSPPGPPCWPRPAPPTSSSTWPPAARGRRGRGALAALAAAVPDAEAVHVVNNGAAALVLAATALAAGREIVLARGRDGRDRRRLPDPGPAGLDRRPAARGRHHQPRHGLADYAAAVGRDTGFVLKVHPSNFVVTGFTSTVPTAELATLPAPVVVDTGSGLLAPHPAAARRAGRRLRAAGRRRAGHRQRRQAARRPAGRAAARPGRAGRAAAPAPAGPGAAGGQAHPGRAGGDAARPDDPDRTGPRRGLRRAAGPGRPARRAAAARPASTRPLWTVRPRSAAAARPGWCCPAPRSACRRRTRSRCGPATRRCSAGWSAGAACSTCARWTRPTTAPLRRAVLAVRRD